MHKKNWVLLLCSCFILMILAGGCQSETQKPLLPDQDTQPNQDMGLSASDKRIMASRFSTIAESTDGVKSATVVVDTADTAGDAEPNEMVRNYNNTPNTQSPNANNNQITTPPNSANNNVVSTNNLVAMVGITMNDMSAQGTAKEETLKQTVRQRIMDSDKRVSEVLVTTDPNMVQKIKDVAKNIINGKPTSSYAGDIRELENNLK